MGYNSNNNEEVNNLKLSLKLEDLEGFKEFIYTDGLLTRINIWIDNTLTTKTYQVDYIYSGSELSQVITERISDNVVYIKTLTYDINGNLQNIETIKQ